MAHIDLATLNPEQRQCVETRHGPLMLLAGAGTGKTRVITYRIANMLAHGTPASQIVALTFTNKAAREMKERVTELCPRDAKALTVSTFHSFCLQILRQFSQHAGLGNQRFAILSSGDQLDLVKRSMGERGAAGKFRAESVQVAISSAKNQLWTSQDIAEKANIDSMQGVDPALLAEIFDVYERQLRLHHAIDFDDCIYRTVFLLQQHPEIRAGLANRYQHMMVDEFQDTNYSQLCVVNELCRDHRNICVVGDDDQSIYSWRGAMAAVLIMFEELFAERVLIKLEQNYRCTNIILNAANMVIKNNTARKSKKLWSESQLMHGIVVAEKDDEVAECRWIAERIIGLLGKGYKPSDIAILYRANALSRNLEIALREANLRYKVYGGQSLFERKEVKDVVAYLRLIGDHEHRMAFLRVINTPARGFGLKTLERLQSLADDSKQSLYATLHHVQLEITGKTKVSLDHFCEGISSFKQRQIGSRADFETLVNDVIKYFKLDIDARATASTTEIGERRVEFLKRMPAWLGNFAERMFEGFVGFDLHELIDQLTLNENDSKDDKNLEHCISLMTVHAAKGLEFPCVFVCGLEDGIFPHKHSLESLQGIEEERRLFYVALTRAKHFLHLSHAKARTFATGAVSCKPSRFLKEMPEEGLIKESGAQEAADPQARRDKTRERLSSLRRSLGQTSV